MFVALGAKRFTLQVAAVGLVLTSILLPLTAFATSSGTESRTESRTEPAPAGAPAAEIAAPTALDELSDLDALPRLNSFNTTYQTSSRDLSDGNGDSGGFLYVRDGRYVLIDELGPGVINRIWMTFPAEVLDKGDIEFTFDDESQPRLRLRLDELFSGRTAPFLAPLAGNYTTSSGGYYSYLPIPFARAVRVSVSQRPSYWQITYQLRRADAPVMSYHGREDSSQVRRQWSQVGTDPKPTAGNQTVTGTVSLPPQGTATLAQFAGSGEIRSLRLQVPPEHLEDIWLEASWEDESAPSVSAPLADFFGSGLGPTEVRGLLVGQSPTGDLYCFLPMPFHRSARLTLRNQGLATAGISFSVQYRLGPPTADLPSGIGHLRTQWRDAAPDPADLDFTVLEASGQGKFIGLMLTMIGPVDERYPGFLEGDEWLYVDDDQSLRIGGTGLEDYFNSGYYFAQGPSTLPLHGAPVAVYDEAGFYYSAYRFHLGDAISFRSSFRFGIEYYPHALRPIRLRSLVLWYGRPEVGISRSDEFVLSDAVSWAAHQAHQVGTARWEEVSSSYGARRQWETIPALVHYQRAGSFEFTAETDPANSGISLERWMDWAVPHQAARVLVDQRVAGVWRTAGANPMRRWHNARFEIPPCLTRGKPRVRIRLEPLTDWSAVRYRVDNRADRRDPSAAFPPTAGSRAFLPIVARAAEVGC